LYYYHKKKIQGLSPNFIEIHCKSLVDKYINRNERLNDLCLIEFVIKYDTKVNKRCSKSKMICWISFNQHKNLENRYKELILLFKPFQKSEFNFQNNCDSWKNPYMEIYIYIYI